MSVPASFSSPYPPAVIFRYDRWKEIPLACVAHDETQSDNGLLFISWESQKKWRKKIRWVEDLGQLEEDKVIFAEWEKVMEDNL
jgi:hypothetical protein